MSNIAEIKKIVLQELEDGREHTSVELKEKLIQSGIKYNPQSGVLRTVIYQMRNAGINIISSDRGKYRLVNEEHVDNDMEGFFVVEPEKKGGRYCVFLHEDGKIVLNGALNRTISSREIEIRISNDLKKILLIENGNRYHRFTKAGTTTNGDFIAMIKRRRMTFPVAYQCEFDAEKKMWSGVLTSYVRKTK